MARYASDHKEATRRRIIETAGRRLKQDGIDGAGIAALMSDAGLTNGAFYAHFASKSDLIAAVVADQLDAQAAAIAQLPEGREALIAYVTWYLSPEHRLDVANGCPSAALLDEIARQGGDIGAAYQRGIAVIVDEVAKRLTSDWSLDHALAKTRAVGLMTVLISSLQLARAMADEQAVDQILRAGLDNARALLAS
ncbi:TetR family transcriptional regulator [Mycolicibacterium chitae]|uniref:Transcriptional regulator, TetR family n=1 Tax=Mycolicibacterium chitae TaxID=1792 RepID=A0A448I9G0_MYCCI|nr:TetR/AcrR family transcriptional regulator [Mycolicibacterium chitae]MCV7104499.1 TetR/AcrR family transcriptional regulator [Mycolicibacterium chitae]BBZ05434.1 TetR family transcriptional regulator [Mycolicibacterium chitae]VEG49050.1 Transcriptional regulator, TetR family [Mycolicibacterium chitae]